MIHALGIGVASLVGIGIAAAATVRLTWEKNADVDRTVFRVLGISFAFSRYDPEAWVSVPGMDPSYLYWEPRKLARPFSGAALGIAWSFWIYTRRRALGRAMVCDWALLAYLQVIVADILVTTESGDVAIKPAKRYGPGEHVRVVIANKNPCRAVGDVTAEVLIERESRTPEGRAWTGDRALWTGAILIEASQTGVVELEIVAPDETVIVERLKYRTEPTGDFRVGRLHGRPEWEA
jgi:hypothetical protein